MTALFITVSDPFGIPDQGGRKIVCSRCGESLPATVDHFPLFVGKGFGRVCLACLEAAEPAERADILADDLADSRRYCRVCGGVYPDRFFAGRICAACAKSKGVDESIPDF